MDPRKPPNMLFMVLGGGPDGNHRRGAARPHNPDGNRQQGPHERERCRHTHHHRGGAYHSPPGYTAGRGHGYPHGHPQHRCNHKVLVNPMELIMMMQVMQQLYGRFAPQGGAKQKANPKPMERFVTEYKDMSEYMQSLGKETDDPEKKKEVAKKAVRFKSTLEELRTWYEKDGSSNKEMKPFLEQTHQISALLEEVSNGADVEMGPEGETDVKEGTLSGTGDSIVSNLEQPGIDENSTSSFKNYKATTFSKKDQNKLIASNMASIKLDQKKHSNSMNNGNPDAKKEIEELRADFKRQLKTIKQEHEKELAEMGKKVEKAYDDQDRKQKSPRETQDLKEKDALIVKLQKECDKLNQRISNGSNRRPSDTPDIKSTPDQIVAEYEQIKREISLKAKKDLGDEISDDRDKDKFLCDILLTAEEVAKIYYLKISTDIYKMLTKGATELEVDIDAPTMTTLVSNSKMADSKTMLKSEDLANGFKDMPEKLKIAIAEYFRMSADQADIDGMLQAINNRVWNSDKSPQLSKHDLIRSYIDSCGKLAWKMVLQTPSMKFDRNTGVGKKWEGEKKQNLSPDSPKPVDSKCNVKYYVHPALMQGDAILCKGTVFVAKK